jgi:vancomycin resistance protein YoaR
MEKEIKTPRRNHRLLAAVGVLLIILLAAPFIAYAVFYSGRILPGVYVAGADLGGLTPTDALTKINALIDEIKLSGIVVTNGKTTVHLEDDAVFNADDALAQAYAVGHSGSAPDRAKDAAAALITNIHIPISGSLEPEAVDKILKTAFSGDERPAADAKLIVNMDGNNFVSALAAPENYGLAYDYAGAENAVGQMLISMQIEPVRIKETAIAPVLFKSDVEAVTNLVPSALALAPLTIQAEDKKSILTANILATLLTAKKDDAGNSELVLDEDAAGNFLKNLSDAYDIPAADTHLEVDTTTNRMTSFTAGRDGRRVNPEKTLAVLNDALATVLAGNPPPKSMNAVTETAKSQVVSDTAAALGIKEVLGTGRSNYKVSSANRIKNIAHGVSKLNGILIAPDEVFSTLAALSPLTAADGYVPELVILGDEFKNEVGGGLCQIGTTTFRAAMNSGLPILERQNHSLVISHYLDPKNNQPGTDATIYDPEPNLKFKNDTGHWILFTADMNLKTGDLAFSFWGTPDGRQGSYSAPKVARWINYLPDIKNIETDTLAPGVTKCQNPFRGADASFVYTVTFADGTKKDRTFVSHYKPLQKICLVGKAAAPTLGTPANLTNTPIVPPGLPAEAAVGN